MALLTKEVLFCWKQSNEVSNKGFWCTVQAHSQNLKMFLNLLLMENAYLLLNIFTRIINDLVKEKPTTFSKLYYDLTIEKKFVIFMRPEAECVI